MLDACVKRDRSDSLMPGKARPGSIRRRQQAMYHISHFRCTREKKITAMPTPCRGTSGGPINKTPCPHDVRYEFILWRALSSNIFYTTRQSEALCYDERVEGRDSVLQVERCNDRYLLIVNRVSGGVRHSTHSSPSSKCDQLVER